MEQKMKKYHSPWARVPGPVPVPAPVPVHPSPERASAYHTLFRALVSGPHALHAYTSNPYTVSTGRVWNCKPSKGGSLRGSFLSRHHRGRNLEGHYRAISIF